MKKIEWLVKWDLYWAKITTDSQNKEVADSVNPNNAPAKLVLLNEKKDKVYILSEDRVLPIAVHHYSGTSRNYYTDEEESYSYDDCAQLYFFSNFDIIPRMEKITSSTEESTLSFNDAMKIEKYQNLIIKQKETEAENKKILYSINEKRSEEKRNEEKQREEKARTNYPELIK